ncbi:MAG: nucleotidyltransferase domain-containing protein [Candidatus Paceibacteria bacterium]
MIELSLQKKEKIEQIAQKYSLELVLLFGSQITGKTHKESDYDIGYLSKKNLDIGDEGNLIIDLLPIVEKRDERIINLVNIKKASPLLLYAITTQAQVLYEKSSISFAKLRAYGFKKYIEMKPMYKERERRIQKQFT